jgi:regulatory protein
VNESERPQRQRKRRSTPAYRPRPSVDAEPAEEPASGVISAVRTVRGGAVAIEVDGLPWLTVSYEAALAHGLLRGLPVDAQTAAALLAFDERRKAYEAALLLISYRPRSESELRSRLARRGLSAEAVAEAIERVRRAGLLDDAAFARAWVDDRASARGRGKRTLAAELRAKGVDAEAADAALASIDEGTRAIEAARQRSARLGDVTWREFQQKLGAFLNRRGFGYETINAALRELWRERQDES